ncbi:MAG: type I DNA topoisomerase [Lachnospiraceae bacterium]|nr:type I DNA topoisomerase [Lachnospiraceae bacterium]
MANCLVIVESPAKVKTIKKFLGANYEVDASNGHVRDLPKSQLGFDAEHGFEPKYITIRGKGDILAKLRKEVKKADKIYLATDPDREGEAISWHLMKALKLDEAKDKKVYRISFNEITKNAVKNSIKNPRTIDMDLVNAQQARRMLDRMVGYRISPLLWEKVKRGLSAGRVQSVALRMVCDREEEIGAFIPEEYWSLEADLKLDGVKKPLTAKFYGTQEGRSPIPDKEALDHIKDGLKDQRYVVTEVKTGERTKKAPLPFTTSTLQQEASKVLNFSTQKTMRLAQQLYEGVEIKGHGTVGLITYLRTDSTRVAEEADGAARAYISGHFGQQYLSEGENGRKGSGKIQDAHEAIRPTDIALTPVTVKESLARDLFRLYQLIWKRFAASRMANAVYETTSVKVGAGEYVFTLTASKLAFDGFMSVYVQEEDKEEGGRTLSKLEKGMELELEALREEQHFTQPPAHYTEASLVKALEEQGIGRPSTYAPTITTILARRYVTKENKNLYVTELGEVVNGMMKQCFPSIVDKGFTANLEYLLDKVGDGTVDWKTVVSNFYPDLEEAVVKAEEELESVTIADEVTDEICELCGRNLVIKYGPHGKFLACPGFPECKNTKPYLEKIGVPCPKCGKELVIKKTKKGRRYYGCEANPDCDFMSWQKPSARKCPECGGYMVEKGDRLLCADAQCGYSMDKRKEEDKDRDNDKVSEKV